MIAVRTTAGIVPTKPETERRCPTPRRNPTPHRNPSSRRRTVPAPFIAAGLLALLSATSSVRADDPAPALLLTGARVLDPSGERLMDGRNLLIRDGHIRRIGPHADRDAPENPRRVDATGLTIIPGLIDLHTHLLLHPYDEATWNDQVLRESLELRTIRAVTAARVTLEAGVTTLRDLGTEGAGYADVALRDAVASGLIRGPRIYTTTRAIVATGCYGPSGFDPRWDVPIGAQVADGADELRRAVRGQIAAGADWIKIYGDYRRRPGAPVTPTFSQEEIKVVVREAHSAGLPVAVHATTDQAIRRAVLAGAATIEHGSHASTDVLVLMRDRGVVLCPTLAAAEAMARYAGYQPGMPEPERIRSARALMKRAIETGVTLACGSDAGVFPHGDNVREIELMVDYGLSPADALRAATATAARVLGRDDLGRIAQGATADLLVIDGNPLQNPAALRNVVMVIRQGKVVVDHTDRAHPR